MVRQGQVDAVVVWKLDRAFRSLHDAVALLTLCRERNVAFVSTMEGIDTSSQFGPVLFALFAAMAEIESTTRSQRLVAWHQQRAEKGMPSGGGTRAFGYEMDGLTVVPVEAEYIRQAVAELLDGSNLTRIIRRWNSTGVLTPTGGKWSKTSFRRMVLSPRIAGVREHADEVYPATWEPIVGYEDHVRLQGLYAAPGRVTGKRYVLAGLAFCGLCGAKLWARPKADGRRCYVCATDHGGCGKIRILAAPVEEFVAREAAREHDYRAEHSRDQQQARRDEDALRRQLEADQAALDELARDRYVTRSISPEEFRAARDPLVERISDAQASLDAPAAGWSRLGEPVEPAPWELAPGTDPDPDDFAYWQRWIGQAVEAVKVGPAVKGRNFFDPSRVSISWR